MHEADSKTPSDLLEKQEHRRNHIDALSIEF
jgi:hypothetical protein